MQLFTVSTAGPNVSYIFYSMFITQDIICSTFSSIRTTVNQVIVLLVYFCRSILLIPFIYFRTQSNHVSFLMALKYLGIDFMYLFPEGPTQSRAFYLRNPEIIVIRQRKYTSRSPKKSYLEKVAPVMSCEER